MKLNINNTEDFEIVAKYLSGEISNDEVFQFEKQVESSPENTNLMVEMKKQWETIGSYKKKEEVDVNKGWQSLYNRLNNEDLIPENRVIENRFAPVWVKWAATVVVLMVIASISFYSINSKNQNLISLQTGNDSNTLIQTLNDGSVVYLANNTSFSYPDQFSSNERRVQLAGEAFFDIASNPQKPFRIETDQVIIEVLGTAFNVKSENGEAFPLAVERGKVRVTLKNDPSQSQIVLPGEKILTSNNSLVKEKNVNSAYFLWKTKRMQFKDENLSNIVKVINTNYKAKIQLQNQALGDRKLTAVFYNNSLKTITELICLSLNLKVEVKPDSTIIIKPINSYNLENSREKNRKAVLYRNLSVFLLFFIFCWLPKQSFSQDSILNQNVTIEEQKATIYNILNQITDATGYFFIYDSRLVNSDKVVRTKAETISIRQLLAEILDNQDLDFKVIDKHILIYLQGKKIVAVNQTKPDTLISLRGQILDKQSNKALQFVTVGLVEKNIGTVSNNDGVFTLRVSSSLINSTLQISHLGYKTQLIPINLLVNQKVEIFLETEFISIQEVIIRNIDPREIIKKANQSRSSNYNQEPIYITSFYREGVLRNEKYLNYSEAVLKVYKSSYSRSVESDQVKLIKSRKIVNVDQKDTLVLKIKAGIKSCLSLDIAKALPDFFDPEYMDSYNYTKADIVSINSRDVYAIDFEQKETVVEPLYKGTLYIDKENFAIVSAKFEINPKLVKETDDLFIVKRSRKFIAKPEKISYTVNYNLRDSIYYVNHIRGDLVIDFRKRYHFFYNRFHAFLELASCQFDTANVVRFSREEILKTSTVFLDANYVYDESFWGNFNTIMPEEQLNEALKRINSKIEESHP